MEKLAHGIYRTPGSEALPNDAYVTDGTMTFPIPEAKYRERGYKPDFERLPWKKDFDAAEMAKASGTAEDANKTPKKDEGGA